MEQREKTENILSVKKYEYHIYGNTLTFLEGDLKYYELWNYFWDIEDSAVKDLESVFKKCGSLENIDKNYDEIIHRIYLIDVIIPALKALHSFSLYEWDKDRLEDYCEECSYNLGNKLFDLYVEPYVEIVYEKEEAVRQRKLRKKYRAKYKGYGYDLQSKMAASVKAGMKNAVVGAGHTAVNAVGNTVSQINASVQVSQIYNDKDRYYELKNACRAMVYGVKRKVEEIIIRETGNGIIIPKQENADRASAILNNIRNGMITGAEAKKAMAQVLQCYPNFGGAYWYAVEKWGDEDSSLKKMASDFYVDLNKHIDVLMEKHYGGMLNTKYQDEAVLLKTKEDILAKTKFYGISAENKYIAHLESEWQILDRKLRTVDGLVFTTREAAKSYIADKETFNNFVSNKDFAMLDLLDENVVCELINEAKVLEYQGEYLKSKIQEKLLEIIQPYVDKQMIAKRLKETGNTAEEVRNIFTSASFYEKIKNRVIFTIDKQHKLKYVLDYIANDEEIIFAQDCSAMTKTWKQVVLCTDKKIVFVDNMRITGVYYEEAKSMQFNEKNINIEVLNNQNMVSGSLKGISKKEYAEWCRLLENIVSALKDSKADTENTEPQSFDIDRVKKRSDILGIASVICGVIGIVTYGTLFIPQILAVILGMKGKDVAKHSWIAKIGLVIGSVMTIFAFLMLGTINMTPTEEVTDNTIKLENYINADMTADEMGETLQNAGLNFVLDDSGEYRSEDRSVWIYNTDLGGCELMLEPTEGEVYSIYGLYCGMTLEEAEEVLSGYNAIEFTYEDDLAIIRRYRLFDSYSVLLNINADKKDINGIFFRYYLYD